MKKICYYPELVDVTGSVTSALMMSQLEFWFKVREGKSFYKFLEPCDHELYKKGDSWQEELGMSSSEVRSAFKKIGTPYKSKRTFMETDDIFKGKLYASYYDRIRKVTYYFRNTAKVKEIFEKLEEEIGKKECLECIKNIRTYEEAGSQSGSTQESEVLEPQSVKTQKLKTEGSRDAKWQDGLYIQDNKQDLQIRQQEESQKEMETHIPYLQVLKSYNAHLGAFLGVREKLTKGEEEQIKYLCAKCQRSIEDFDLCFKKVAESSFLCGRLETKRFMASLSWILKVTHFKRILEGDYDDFKPVAVTGSSMQKIKAFNHMASHDDWDFDEIERLERIYIDQLIAEGEQRRQGGLTHE